MQPPEPHSDEQKQHRHHTVEDWDGGSWPDILSPEAWRLWQQLHITPGDRVTTEELARLIGCSKTRTRTALLELEERGFLTVGEQ